MKLTTVVTVSVMAFIGVVFYANASNAFTLRDAPSLAKDCVSASNTYVKCSDNTHVTDPTQA